LEKISEYLPKLDSSNSRHRSVYYLSPIEKQESIEGYDKLYYHLKSINRAGVVIGSRPSIKEFYIIPVPSKGILPSYISNTDFTSRLNKDTLISVVVSEKKGNKRDFESINETKDQTIPNKRFKPTIVNNETKNQGQERNNQKPKDNILNTLNLLNSIGTLYTSTSLTKKSKE